jgi:hypothetical protein
LLLAKIYELGVVQSELRYFIKHLKTIAIPSTLPVNALAILDSGYIKKQPFGVVLILGTTNCDIVIKFEGCDVLILKTLKTTFVI